jgi:hypothetical protein
MDLLQPDQWLVRAERRFPDLWKLVDFIIVNKGKNGMPNWASWCLLYRFRQIKEKKVLVVDFSHVGFFGVSLLVPASP